MGIRAIWNALEAVLVEQGFPLLDTDEVPQGKRSTLRVTEIPSEQPIRGTVGSGKIRLTFAIQVVLFYEVGTDRRLERKIAEDAESTILAIYNDVNLANHRFVGSSIDRDAARGLVMNTIRFDFQSQA
jgi:hypothetical protein